MLRVLCSAKVYLLIMVACVAVSGVQSVTWAGDDTVAQISKISGAITIQRGSESVTAAKGARLKNGDTIATGLDGAVGLLFNDDTTLALGPGSTLTIQEFVFEPDRSRFAFVVKLLKGTASYVSGLIAKLSPEATKFITPSSSIGVRGTKFVVEVEAQ
jgi:hypothetical protein